MRITADLLHQAGDRLNPLNERELDLRGYQIPVIENLGILHDGYDAIDLSDNEIQRLENFPRMLRMRTLLLNNNLISRVADGLGDSMPDLDMLCLTGNRISSLTEINGIAAFKKLTVLSLLHNPVTKKKFYRLYVIHKLPSLRLLDFSKVTVKERKAAEKLFESKAGQALEQAVAKARTYTPGETARAAGEKTSVFTAEQLQKIQTAIQSAQTPEEIDRLEKYLKSGQMPPELGGSVENGGGGGAPPGTE